MSGGSEAVSQMSMGEVSMSYLNLGDPSHAVSLRRTSPMMKMMKNRPLQNLVRETSNDSCFQCTKLLTCLSLIGSISMSTPAKKPPAAESPVQPMAQVLLDLNRMILISES